MRLNMRLALSSLDQNTQYPKTEVDESFLTKVTSYVKSLGVGSIGYTNF